MQDRVASESVVAYTEEWRRQLGNARTRCEPPILSYSRDEGALSNIKGLIIGTIIIIAYAYVCVC